MEDCDRDPGRPNRYLWNVMPKDRRGAFWVRTWLLAGVVMVLFQILLGGITRLTGSGLSITRWEIVTGTLPPLSDSAWETAFSDYRFTPQYQKINQGMTLGEFKFIYFWEYFHRLWARSMGFVFLIPFVIFSIKGWIHRKLLQRLGIVILLALLAATFGWIMVASGLKDRPWVNAYKLTIHLLLGTSLFVMLCYTWIQERGWTQITVPGNFIVAIRWLMGLTLVQLAFGGFMAGMKASMLYPSWPDFQGSWIPAILLDASHWNLDNFLLYDQSGFMPALVQFVHRNLAYLILLIVCWFAFQWIRKYRQSPGWPAWGLVGIILVQILLGILTLIGSIGKIPLLEGVLHQGVGIVLFAYQFYILLVISKKHIYT